MPRPGTLDSVRAEERRYYELRAPEYDDWYLGRGVHEGVERPGWEEELARLVAVIEVLPPGRVLDVACGTGFLTRHLRGEVTGIDQSATMLEIARGRCPGATLLQADALALPFEGRSFDRVFTGHFYGHLRASDRQQFLLEARRLAPELVVVDTALRPGLGREEVHERVLSDGSRHAVYKRYFPPEELTRELGGGRTLHAGDWFVVVAT
jgi:demethylmenaquinone methyltransferase/2-methoxy-6-polyprenyl-1,4-benzoquinol methylase